MRRLLWALALLVPAPLAAHNPAELASEIRLAGLDPEQCFRVRDLSLSKEDLRLFFTEGYLIIGKPVRGRRLSAVFSADVEGGDGELLVMPPLRSERLSLATFTGSPNLNEHFLSALMVFSDDTAEALIQKIHEQPRLRPSPEMGMVLAGRWDSVVANLSNSFGARLVYDLLSGRPTSEGFFYAGLQGRRHGNFDVVYDPVATEQIQVGQVAFRNDRAFFDVWTSFQSRSVRTGGRKPLSADFTLRDYRIEATLESDLTLRAVTRATLTVQNRPQRVLFFDISPRMKVSSVVIGGEPCEVWQRDSLRANLFGGGTGLFLVTTERALEPGEYPIEFRHEGQVVSEAGNGVYYVGARSTWYPFHGVVFSHFDIRFRYPEDLSLVFPGQIVEDSVEGDWRVTRRKTENPVRLAGFNVGAYERVEVARDGLKVEVYANRQVEQALQPKQQVMIVPRPDVPWPARRGRPLPEMVAVPMPVERPDPTARLQPLAEEVADAFQFLSELFGPPPARTLMVSPIPGTFGQGFPGLLYLSTVAYLDPKDRPEAVKNTYHEFFYSEILHAHETAHQWWGNSVTAESYQDDWLMEALANYSALLLLERRKGAAALKTVLDHYRDGLLAVNEAGKTVESAGPISWGTRLDSSQARAWRIITYEKGSWIIHMIRRRLGDERFLKMLGDLCRAYRFRALSVEDFRRHAARYVPDDVPDRDLVNFFEQWVYDVGIPKLQFSHQIRGRPPKVRVTGKVTQSGVANYFSALVPVEFQFARSPSVVRWLRTSEEPATFDYTFRERPARVVFNPGDGILAAN